MKKKRGVGICINFPPPKEGSDNGGGGGGGSVFVLKCWKHVMVNTRSLEKQMWILKL